MGSIHDLLFYMDSIAGLLFAVIAVPVMAIGLWTLVRGKKTQAWHLVVWGIVGLALGPVILLIAFITAPPMAWSGSAFLGEKSFHPWRDPNFDNHYLLFVAAAWALGILWLLVLAFMCINWRKK